METRRPRPSDMQCLWGVNFPTTHLPNLPCIFGEFLGESRGFPHRLSAWTGFLISIICRYDESLKLSNPYGPHNIPTFPAFLANFLGESRGFPHWLSAWTGFLILIICRYDESLKLPNSSGPLPSPSSWVFFCKISGQVVRGFPTGLSAWTQFLALVICRYDGLKK